MLAKRRHDVKRIRGQPRHCSRRHRWSAIYGQQHFWDCKRSMVCLTIRCYEFHQFWHDGGRRSWSASLYHQLTQWRSKQLSCNKYMPQGSIRLSTNWTYIGPTFCFGMHLHQDAVGKRQTLFYLLPFTQNPDLHAKITGSSWSQQSA